MSVKALTWAFEQPVSATEKVVLLALADHADNSGLCWPSIALLMQRAHVGERTVQRAVQSLEQGGFLVRERRHRENGSDTSNLYRLRLDRVSQGVSGSVKKSQETSGGVNLAPHRGVTQTGGGGVMQTGGEGVTQTVPRTVIKNRKKEPPTILAEAEFEAFWAAYPKRPNNPKQPAIRRYVNARQVLKVSHETLVNAAKAYADSRAGQDPRYTAQTKTWLNERRWEADYGSTADVKISVPLASDEQLDAVVKIYPGVVSDRMAARKHLAAELAKGTGLEEIVAAATKFRIHMRQMRESGMTVAEPILETWLKFKWREMDAYEIYSNPVERRPILRPVKGKRQ